MQNAAANRSPQFIHKKPAEWQVTKHQNGEPDVQLHFRETGLGGIAATNAAGAGCQISQSGTPA
jgi:hypothetical protein